MKIVAVLGTATSASDFLSKYSASLEDLMKDPEAHFYINGEASTAVWLIQYLNKRKFQAFTIFHVGDCYRRSSDCEFRGGYLSASEVEIVLRELADLIVQ